jgi:hypothetical protein
MHSFHHRHLRIAIVIDSSILLKEQHRDAKSELAMFEATHYSDPVFLERLNRSN